MTLSSALLLGGAQPCQREKRHPQVTRNAVAGGELSPASLGGKGNCWVLCLWFLWQIGASRDRKLENLASLPHSAAPCAEGCWNRLARSVNAQLCAGSSCRAPASFPCPSFKLRGPDNWVERAGKYQWYLNFGHLNILMWDYFLFPSRPVLWYSIIFGGFTVSAASLQMLRFRDCSLAKQTLGPRYQAHTCWHFTEKPRGKYSLGILTWRK